MVKTHPEKILCIKESILFGKEKWNGLKTDDLSYYKDLVEDNMEFICRDDLENDPTYKQVIAQVVLRYKGKYFLHRQVNRGEKRLNSLCPLPFGGHIELFDKSSNGDIIEVALERELHEEAEVNANIVDKTFLGLVYIEDDNPVNYVHVGFVYVFDLDGDDVHVREEGLETIGFVDVEYLQEHVEELTYWSRFIIPYLK
ncbi:NUDIX domain-containing protein [bacterium]|nr:NUDIX domain-containing protein [bacterium]